MRAVWKYQCEGHAPHLMMPPGAKVVHVARQYPDDPREDLTIWAEVNPSTEAREKRRFTVVATGQQFDNDALTHVATWIDGPFVWHLYEDHR